MRVTPRTDMERLQETSASISMQLAFESYKISDEQIKRQKK